MLLRVTASLPSPSLVPKALLHSLPLGRCVIKSVSDSWIVVCVRVCVLVVAHRR